MAQTNEEKRLALQKIAAETGGKFRMRLNKTAPGRSTSDLIAVFDGAEIGHFLAPELWLRTLSGGGRYTLVPHMEGDGSWQPLAGVEGAISIEVGGAPTLLDYDAIGRSDWIGPSVVIWPPADDAKSRDALRLMMAPPAAGPSIGGLSAPSQAVPMTESERQVAKVEAQSRALEAERVRLAEDGKKIELREQAQRFAGEKLSIESRHAEEKRALAEAIAKLEVRMEALARAPAAVVAPSPLAGLAPLIPAIMEFAKSMRDDARAERERRDKREAEERAERIRLEERREAEARVERERRDKIDADRAQRELALQEKLLTSQGPAKQFEGFSVVTDAMGKLANTAASLAVVAADMRPQGEPSTLDAIAVISENLAKAFVAYSETQKRAPPPAMAGPDSMAMAGAVPQQQQQLPPPEATPPAASLPEVERTAQLIREWSDPAAVAQSFFTEVDASDKGDKRLANLVRAAKSIEEVVAIYQPSLAVWFAGAVAAHAANAENDDPMEYLRAINEAIMKENLARQAKVQQAKAAAASAVNSPMSPPAAPPTQPGASA